MPTTTNGHCPYCGGDAFSSCIDVQEVKYFPSALMSLIQEGITYNRCASCGMWSEFHEFGLGNIEQRELPAATEPIPNRETVA